MRRAEGIHTRFMVLASRAGGIHARLMVCANRARRAAHRRYSSRAPLLLLIIWGINILLNSKYGAEMHIMSLGKR